jgi:hypothetical protein
MTQADEWTARSAEALCAGSRWVHGASLGLAAVALWMMYALPPAGATARTALSIAAGAGALQLYYALRIEFDRRIFAGLASLRGGSAETLEALDHAMRELGLAGGRSGGRPLAERARGLAALVRRCGWIFAGQAVLMLAGAWLR